MHRKGSSSSTAEGYHIKTIIKRVRCLVQAFRENENLEVRER